MSASGRATGIIFGMLLCLVSEPVHAQRFGPQLSVEAFAVGVGGRAEFRLINSGRLANTFLATSLDAFFAYCYPGDCVGAQMDANVGVPFLASGRGPYVGLGVGVREMPRNPEPTLNVLAGLRGRFLFGELRINNETLVLTVGALFPGLQRER